MPSAPSAHESLIVFGWLGSGPRPARPFRSVPESHADPTPEHRGACSTGSNTAVCGPPLPFTTSDRSARRVSAPLVPWAARRYVPVAAVGAAITVSVLATLPFGGGVTVAGANEHVRPAGAPAQARSMALAKPFTDETEQVLEALPPCWTAKLEGAHATPKPSTFAAVGVASWHALAGPAHADEAPAAITL